MEKLKFRCKYDIDTIRIARKELFEKSGFMYISKNKNVNNNKTFDIEDFPCKDYDKNKNQYNECNKHIFSEKKIRGENK